MVMSADLKASVTGLLALSNKSAHIFSRSSLVTFALKSTSSNKPSICYLHQENDKFCHTPHKCTHGEMPEEG